MDKPASAKQQRYLRQLAQRTRTTFAPPRTSAQASAEIRRLQRIANAHRGERAADDREVARELQTRTDDATRVHGHETTGHGSTASWA